MHGSFLIAASLLWLRFIEVDSDVSCPLSMSFKLFINIHHLFSGHHAAFDRFELGNRVESEALFDQWLVRVNRMLVMEDREVF